MSLPSGKCSMEVSRLIAEVHRRPELWDRQHPQHHNRSVLDHHWESVANLLGITGKAARGKWKNLKDHFRKEYKRCVTSANSDQEMSRWPYFYSMMFIREQISHPVTMFLTDSQYQNVCPRTEITNAGEEGRRGGGREWVSAGPENGNSPPPDNDDDDDDDGYRPLNCLHVEYGNWSADDHQQDENNFSDDKHFLLSLLPMFSTLTPDKKLKARIAIETSLLNIAYPDLTVQESGGGTTTDGHPSPRRVVERDGTSQNSLVPSTPSTKTTTPDSTLNTTITTSTTTITPIPNDISTSTLTATAVVTATATCTAVKTENKKRNSENDRLQLPKKVCTANSRKC